MSEITPSQTVGPFFAYGLAPHSRCDWKPSDIYDWKETAGANLVTADATGTKIRIEGCVLDGDGMPINDAVSTPRLHHQWQPDEVYVEPGFAPDLLDALRRRGHNIVPVRPFTSVNSIEVGGEGYVGAADRRTRGSLAAGY